MALSSGRMLGTMRTKAGEGMATGVRGNGRVRLLQAHRLIEFQKSFDDYLCGRCDAARVTRRARLMLAIGLPAFVVKRRG